MKHITKGKSMIDYGTKAKIDRGDSGPTNNRNPIMIKNDPPIHKRRDPISIQEIPVDSMLVGFSHTGVAVEVDGPLC